MKIRNAAVALATATALTATGLASARPIPFTKPNHINLCHFEDGSGQSLCVWDAVHEGNGDGHSVLVIRHGKNQQVTTVVRIRHRRAHRLIYGNSNNN